MRKILSFVFAFIIASSMATFSASASECSIETATSELSSQYMLNPSTGEYLLVRDLTVEMAALSSQNTRDYEFEAKFEESRMKNGLNTNRLDGTAGEFDNQFGYGYEYNNNYRYDYLGGSAISHDIICPTKPGGNVNTWLYLTSTNRTSVGVEAFILYNGQDNLEFKVFDWARSETTRWQLSLTHTQLSNYLYNKSINGGSSQVITVQNKTYLTNTVAELWRNEVILYNINTNTYDIVYSYSFFSSEYLVKNSNAENDIGYWGPFVEAFQESYTTLNTIGFNDIKLASYNANGQSLGWNLLSSSNSSVRHDVPTLNVVFNHPNYAFGVN